MSELSKLKQENKQLRALLRNAVEILNRYKELLEHPQELAGVVKKDQKEKQKIQARGLIAQQRLNRRGLTFSDRACTTSS
jgi:hypothetical protein